MDVVSYKLDGDIGIVRINKPPVNALGIEVRKGLCEVITMAQSDASKALLILGEGRMFTAGADITEFGKPRLDPTLLDVLNCIENSRKPIVAVIHGTTMGGGVELSLCCHYRCALSGARLGLPEVKLGILPGAGGTQRAPRVMGVNDALEMISSGRPLTAKEALEKGLIDHVIDGDLLQGATAFCRQPSR